jgi:hypothetical protein
MSKSKSKQEEALQLLDDLDSFTPIPGGEGIPPSTGAGQPTAEGEAEVLAFLDEITQKSSEPTRLPTIDRPISRSSTPVGSIRSKTTERVRLGGGPVSSSPAKAAAGGAEQKTKAAEPAPVKDAAGGGWGWGSVWSTASAALQQAKSAVDEQVKQLPTNEQAMKWRDQAMEYAKNAQLEKLGIVLIPL